MRIEIFSLIYYNIRDSTHTVAYFVYNIILKGEIYMRNSQRIVALLLCLTLLVSALAIFAAAQETTATEEPQTEVVEPNYTVEAKSNNFGAAAASTAKGNHYSSGTSFSASEGWDVITIGGEKVVHLHTQAIKAANMNITAKNSNIAANPVYVMQFEMIKTGAVGNVAPSMLIGDSGKYELMNKGCSSFATLLKDVKYGELAKINFVFTGVINDKGTPEDVSDDRFYVNVKTFVNGKMVDDMNGTSYEATKINTSNWYGCRFHVSTDSAGIDVILNNMYTQTYTTRDVIAADGNLKPEYLQENLEGYKETPALPAIATVNGVEYNTVANLNAAIAAADYAEIEFLHDYTAAPWATGDKVVIATNATINTNGFIDASGLGLAEGSYIANGNVITTLYVTGSVPYNSAWQEAINSKLDDADTVSTGIDVNAHIFTSYTLPGGKQFFTVKDNPDAANVNMSANFAVGTKKFANYPYQIMQFEAGYIGTLYEKETFLVLAHHGGGNTGNTISYSTLFKGMESGEIAQFTFLYYDSGIAERAGLAIYRNGVQLSNNNNFFNFDGKPTSGSRGNGFRFSGGNTELILGNMHVDFFESDPRATDANGKVNFGAGDQFLNPEFVTTMPAIATVNGVNCYDKKQVNAVLADNNNLPANVEILYNYADLPWASATKITVPADRYTTIDTNGFVDISDFVLPEGYVVNGETIVYHTSNWISEDVLSSSASGSISDEIRSPVTGNIGGSIKINESSNPLVQVHVGEYAKYISNYNVFFSAKRTSESVGETRLAIYPGAGSSHKTIDYPYAIFQFDSAYLGDKIGTGVLQPLFRSSAGPHAFGIQAATLYEGLKPGEVAQFTFLFLGTAVENYPDHSNWNGITGCYVYRNGELIYKSANAAEPYEGWSAQHGYTNFNTVYPDEIRTYLYSSHLVFDNLYTYYYTEDPRTIGEDGKYIFGSNDQFQSDEYTKLTLAPVALIDKEAATYEEAEKILADGGNHEVELLHQPVRPITVASNATIKTNGYTGIVVDDDYLSETVDGVITVTKDERTTNIKVTLDGEVIATIDGALYKSDHEAQIRALLLAREDFEHNANVLVKDGKYYEINWNGFELPEHAEEITYSATTVYHPLLAVNAKTNAVVSDRFVYDENGTLIGGKFRDITVIVYFNQDINSLATSTDGKNTMLFGNGTWYMNGYTYTSRFDNDNDHIIYLDNKYELVINDGSFDINRGSGAFMTSQAIGANPTLTLKNVTIKTTAIFADVRSGTVNFENCVINSSHFMIGARTSGNTQVNFKNCVINSTSNSSFVAFCNNSTSFPGDYLIDYVDKEGNVKDTRLPNVARYVTFDGTKLYIPNGYIVSMPEDPAYNLDDGRAQDRNVTLVNSTLYSAAVGSIPDNGGVVVFDEGVRYTVTRGAYGMTPAEGVQLGVKDNNMAYALLATKNYATVIWDENTTEYWAAGSTPVASVAAYKNFLVTAVEANKTYNLTVGDATEYKLIANLTLENNIFYNIYVDGATAVYVNGTKLEANTIQGVTRYSYELLPAFALGEIHVVIEFEGATYSRNTNLMEYVNASAKSASGELVQLYAAMLTYLLEVQKYDRVIVARAAAEAFLKTNGTFATPDEMDPAEDNMAELFNSVYCYLDGSFNLIFNTKFNGEVTVTAGEEEFTLTAEDNLLVVTLPAYALAEDLVFTVGDVTATYNLAAYTQSLNGNSAHAVAEALFNYAYNAKAYAESEQ